MFPRTVETAFARFQAKGEPRALAIVFDRTAPELMRLARHLAKDANEAEDLLQATFLTAIESAASHQRGRPVLPWLSGILANHARSTRRHDRRAPDRSRLVAERVQDVHADVDERELRHEVLDAIQRLPEVYRPVLRLWLEHGLEAHEIATTLERPAGTVRAQVTRGLDQLRRLLPASLATGTAIAVASRQSLAAVREHVLANCTGSTGLTGTLALGGLMLMHHKISVAALAVLATFATWATWRPVDEQPLPPAGPDVPVAAERAAVDTTPAAGDTKAAREDALADAAPPPAPTTGAAPEPSTTSLVIRVRDRDTGQALAGYGVAIGDDGALQEFGKLPDFHATDATGAIRFDELAPGVRWVFLDRTPQPSRAVVHAGRANEHVVELSSHGVVVGHVRTPDGHPVPQARVFVLANRIRPTHVATADASGRFELRHTQDPTLIARARGFAPSPGYSLSTQNGGDIEITMRLGTGARRISGTARNHDGRPLVGGTVAILPASARDVRVQDPGLPRRIALCVDVDEHGNFTSDEVGAAEHVVVAIPRDQELPPATATVDTTHADAFVDLTCAAPTTITGRILADDLQGALLLAFPERPADPIGYLINLVGLRRAPIAADGTFRLVGALPGRVALRAVRGMQVLAEQHIDLAAGDSFRWTPGAVSTDRLAIRVRAPGRLPEPLFSYVFTKTTESVPSMAVIGRDGRGVAEVARSGPVDVVLSVPVGAGEFIQLARQADVPTSQGLVEFDLSREQLPTSKVVGRLVDAAGAPLPATTVQLRSTGSLIVLLKATTDAAGRFSIGPAPAGRYSLYTGEAAAPNSRRDVTLTTGRDEDVGDFRRP